MIISVRVYPNAPTSEVSGFVNDVLQVKIKAPPVRGKANQELVALLSRLLGVSKGKIAIVRGQTARNKVLSIDGLNPDDILKRLSSA